MIYGIRHKKIKEIYQKKRCRPGWEDVVMWRDFRPPHVFKGYMGCIFQNVMSEHF